MIEFQLTPKSKQVAEKMKNMDTEVKQALRNASKVIGKDVKKEMKKLITTGARSGRLYRIHQTIKRTNRSTGDVTYMRRGRWHQASAPGEPPAKLTGRLSRSIHYRTSYQGIRFIIKAPYANRLEHGPKGRPSEARPFVSRTINMLRRRNIRTLERHLLNQTTR